MATGNNFSDFWNEAVQKYEKATGRIVRGDSQFLKFREAKDLEKELESVQSVFTTYRAKHEKVYSTLKNIFKPLEPITRAVELSIGNTTFAPVCAVLGAINYLFKACNAVSAAYDGLQGLFEDISDITARLNGASVDRMDVPLREKITDIYAYILEIVGMSEACLRRKRFKQWGRAVLMRDDGIQYAITKLNKFVNSEVGLVLHLTYGHVNDLRDRMYNLESNLGSVATGVGTVRDGIDAVITNQQEYDRKGVSEADETLLKEYLATSTLTTVQARHEEYLQSLAKGTGLWIRDDPLFRTWQEEASSLLWIFGKPGTGKTFLAAKTIDILLSAHSPQLGGTSLTSVSYFYIKEDDPNLHDISQLLKTLALQIASSNDYYRKFIISVIQKGSPASTKSMWERLFLDFFTEERSSREPTGLAYIVIDGLDEAPERERVRLIACLRSLVSRTNKTHRCRIQIAIFSRPMIQADVGFDQIGLQSRDRVIEVSPKRTEEDMSAFVKQRLRDIRVLNSLNARRTPEATKQFKSLARQIVSSVTGKSNGMFKWAGLMFDQIWRLQSPEAIIQALRTAPKGLHEIIHHTIRRLELEEPARAVYLQRIFIFVYCAFRPLSIAEIFILLLIVSDEHCYELEHDLRHRYGSFFDTNRDEKECDEQADKEGDTSNPQIFETQPSLFDDLDDTAAGDMEGAYDSDADYGDVGSIEQDILLENSSGDQIQTIDPQWSRFAVGFSHTSIRDYLEQETTASTKRWHDSSISGDQWNMAHLSVASACIRLLSDKIHMSSNSLSLEKYAKLFFMKHLNLMELSTVGSFSISYDIGVITDLFYDGLALLETSFNNADDAETDITKHFVRTWFGYSRSSRKIRELLSWNEKDSSNLEDEKEKWVRSAIRSSRALFEPLILACLRKWLTKRDWDDDEYLDKSEHQVWIIWAFSTLTDDGENTNININHMDWYDFLSHNTAPEIEALANLKDSAKNEHFHTGLGWILGQERHLEEAVSHFLTALDLSPTGWVAMEGIANCYGRMGEYMRAIDWMHTAIDHLPEKFGHLKSNFSSSIIRWERELEPPQRRIQIAQHAYNSNKVVDVNSWEMLDAIKDYFEALYQSHYYNDLVKLLYELDETATLVGSTLLIAFMRAQCHGRLHCDLYERLGDIASHAEEPEFEDRMTAATDRAIEYKRTQDVAISFLEDDPEITLWLNCRTAWWKCDNGKPCESLAYFEAALEIIDQGNSVLQQSETATRAEAAAILSTLYYKRSLPAAEAGDKTTAHDSLFYAQKLKQLARHKQGGAHYWRPEFPAVLYGIYLRDNAHADEAAWRACFRPTIKQSLLLLDDDDPWNDQDPYVEIGETLLRAGDTKNGRIALGLVLKPQLDFCEAIRANEDNVLGNPEELEVFYRKKLEREKPWASNRVLKGFDFRYECDGDCKAQAATYRYSELHICMFCNDTIWCGTCAAQLDALLGEGGKIKHRTCSPRHKFVQILPLSPEAKDTVDAIMRKDFAAHKNWLDKIKREWE